MVTFVNESKQHNGTIETETGLTASTLQKNKITSTRLEGIATKNKLSKNSQRVIKETNLATPIKKAPSPIAKFLTMTSMEEDAEIVILDDYDSIKAIEKEGVQVQGTGSTQEEIRSLANGSGSQDRHWN